MPKLENSKIVLKFDFDFRVNDFNSSADIIEFYHQTIHEYLDNICDDLGIHNVDVYIESGKFNEKGKYDTEGNIYA